MVNAQITAKGELGIIPAPHSDSSHFDFLVGQHRVVHRMLKSRLTGSEEWVKMEGFHQQERLLKGLGNLEQHYMLSSDGTRVEGIALRLFDPKTRLWSIYWADSLTGELEPPVVGSFDKKIGHFYGKGHWKEKFILIQFVWYVRDATAPAWSQAFSVDNGKTWDSRVCIANTKKAAATRTYRILPNLRAKPYERNINH